MNKILTLAIAALSSMPMFAALNTMNYQAVINNPDGQPAADTSIGLRFAIVADDNTLFSEEAIVKSSDKGLVEWQIGSSKEEGLSNVNWTLDGIELQVSIDLNGGTDYTTVYSSNIQSVPTAMYAEKTGESDEFRSMFSEIKAHIDLIEANTNEMSGKLIDIYEELRARIDESQYDYRNYIEQLYGNIEALRNDLMAQQTRLEDLINYTDARVSEIESENAYNRDIIQMLMNEVANLQIQIEEIKNK